MKTNVKRLDHLGIVAGVIKDLGLVDLINERIPEHPKEEISVGEAIAGMIINGLGFSNRPLSLTPQFFQSKAMDKLFREGIEASHFNRFKLGRALDDCYKYGCSNLFAELSMAVCRKEKIDRRFNSEDTTSFSLTGEYEPDCDEHAIKITHGYSKDHRPDLKQAVVEMMVSHDGGVPLVYNAHDGNASDTQIFRDRSRALLEAFKEAKIPRYLIADSKLYSKETLHESLKNIPFITRVPASVNLEQSMIAEMLEVPLPHWQKLDDSNRFQSIAVNHFDLEQRWIVVFSDAMKSRSQKRVEKAIKKEEERAQKALIKLSKKRFSSVDEAENAILEISNPFKLHQLSIKRLVEHKAYEGKGRPTAATKHTIVFEIEGQFDKITSAIENMTNQGSCYVLATTIPQSALTDEEIVKSYKRQNESVERGFRFLKDPVFFTSSLFVKKPQRIEGLLRVMTLALLVYAIAQRTMRAHLNKTNQAIPNQINQQTSTPTLRWVFQIFEGIDSITIEIDGKSTATISGLEDLHYKILECFPPPIRRIYGIAA